MVPRYVENDFQASTGPQPLESGPLQRHLSSHSTSGQSHQCLGLICSKCPDPISCLSIARLQQCSEHTWNIQSTYKNAEQITKAISQKYDQVCH
jgi:hypothetical protein